MFFFENAANNPDLGYHQSHDSLPKSKQTKSPKPAHSSTVNQRIAIILRRGREAIYLDVRVAPVPKIVERFKLGIDKATMVLRAASMPTLRGVVVRVVYGAFGGGQDFLPYWIEAITPPITIIHMLATNTIHDQVGGPSSGIIFACISAKIDMSVSKFPRNRAIPIPKMYLPTLHLP